MRRHFASSSLDDWRKQQLQKLQQKFSNENNSISHSNNNNSSILFIDSEEELQPQWKEMESRVTRRKPRSVQQTIDGRPVKRPTGRMNVRKTDEDVWAQEGMYEEQQEQRQSTTKSTTDMDEVGNMPDTK
jgi:hypothetical protein